MDNCFLFSFRKRFVPLFSLRHPQDFKPITSRGGRLYNEAREARSAEPFFLGFPGEKKPFHIGLHTRVGCLERLSLCAYVCGSQHFFRPRLSTALNVHGTKTSPNGSRAHKKQTALLEVVSL